MQPQKLAKCFTGCCTERLIPGAQDAKTGTHSVSHILGLQPNEMSALPGVKDGLVHQDCSMHQSWLKALLYVYKMAVVSIKDARQTMAEGAPKGSRTGVLVGLE